MDLNSFVTLLGTPWAQIGISCLIVALTAIFARPVIQWLVHRTLRRLAARSKTGLDDVLIGTIDGPLYWLLVFIALQVALERLSFIQRELDFQFEDIYFILYLIVGLVMVWRLVGGLADWYGQEVAPVTKTALDKQMVPFVKRILLAIVLISSVIILLDHFQVDATGLVATLGIGSLAIALAAQESLSDTIASFMIILDQPFRVGDRIAITELDTWGDVVDIGLRSTRILTLDHRMIIVPNSIIGKNLVVNYSYPSPQVRNHVEVGVAYGVDLDNVKAVIIEAVQAVEGVSASKPVEPLLNQFGDSSLVFRVRYWVDSYTDTPHMYDKVNSAIYHALGEAGIPIPFPQRDVHVSVDEETLRKLGK